MEDIVEDEPSGLNRLAKPEDIRKRLLKEDPVEYIKKFQIDHGIRLEGLQPILALADVLGLQRGEIYRQLKQTFYTDLTSRIATISEEDGNKLLMASLDFIEDSRLNEIPIKLLSERTGDFPDAVYERLSRMPSEVLARTVPEKPRRRTWELHEDVFRSYCETLIEAYLADRNVQRTSDNMALALDVGARRSKTRPLSEAVGAVGSSPLLFNRFLNRAMERFAETGNPLLCTLVYDMLMAVPKAISKQPLTDDVAHVMDKIKLKHSNDKGFGQSANEEIANRLVELIDLLYLEVVRARDGTLPAAKLTLPPPPQPPVVSYPTLKLKIGGRGVGGRGRGRGGFGRGRGRGAGRGRLGPDVTLTMPELIERVVSDAKSQLPAGQFTWFDTPVIEQVPWKRDAYLMKILEPMDISTIQSKADSYMSLEELKRDFQLIRDNALLDNGKQSSVTKAASALYKIAMKSINDYAPNLVLHASSTGMPSAPNQYREVEDESYGNGDGTESLGPRSPSYSESGQAMDEEGEDYDDFEQDDAKSEPAPSAEPQVVPRPPESPPPVKIVTVKAAQAAMILADPNTHHSLAKMMWDLLVHQVAAKGLAPRQVPVVTKLLWLTYLGNKAQDIVKAFMAKEPSELLNKGPPKSADRPDAKPDLLLHSVLALCTRFFARPGVGMHEKLVELCSSSALAREYVLRFILLEIRAGADRLALDMLRSLVLMVDHPGFRRGLAHVLKSPPGMLQLRRGAIELVFLPYIHKLKDTDSPELADAHEFFAAVVSSPGMLRLAREGQLGMEGAVLADYVRSALTGVTPNLYLSSSFRGARQFYEDLFRDDMFIALRGSLGIPVVPAGTREASPGSTRPSPSPGTFRAQSASPSSYIPRSAGPQSTSPSYSTA